MKLLTPAAQQDLKEQVALRDILRTQELNKASEEARISLAKAEQEFNEVLARNRAQWATEEEEHSQRVKAMKLEIDDLMAKKMNALIPIGILKDGAYDRMDDAVAFLARLRQREENIEDLTEKLEDKLDTVGAKEQDLLQLDRSLKLREEGIERQSQAIRANSQALGEQMAVFALTKETAEKDIEERKTALYLLERTLLTKQQTLERTDGALSALAKQLADERETLKRAFDEVRRREQALMDIPIVKKDKEG